MLTIDEMKQLALDAQCKVESDDLEKIICTQEDASLQSPSVPAHYYRFLYQLVRKVRPDLCLELGTHTGISSACLAEGYPQGKVITINNCEQLRYECKRPNVEYLIQDSLKEYASIMPIDILFIDTEHNGIRCLSEYNLYVKHMAKNSVIFFDDISLNGAMKDFWNAFNPPDGEKFELPVHGWAGFGGILKDA